MQPYARPACLPSPLPQRLLLDASAGTGKTFTLEHLVLDLLLTPHLGGKPLRIDQILVVTFTEKAAGEMRKRIRLLIENLLAGNYKPAKAGDAAWALDEPALQALDQARMQFDRASISTIHGFCQRLLRETAFLSGEPFDTELVDGNKLFRRAVRDCIRTVWGVPDAPREQAIRETLLALGGEEPLLGLLDKVRKEPGERYAGPDPIATAGRFAAAYDRAALEPELLAWGITKGASLTSVCKHLDALKTGCATRSWEDLKPHLNWIFNDTGQGAQKLLAYLDGSPLLEVLLDLQDGLADAHAQAVDRFQLEARDRAAALKEAEGLLDFDDMVGRVAQALAAPGSGDLLAASLQARYQAVLIDEFQDTSPDQWRIFDKAFGQAGRIALIGDPKQAIYGFRGGDVHTYVQARAVLSARGAATVPLDRNFRSTPGMIEAYNAILDQQAPDPFFTGAIRYDHPVAPGKPGLRWVDPVGQDLVPVRLLSVALTGADKIDAVRRRVADALAREVRDLLLHNPVLIGGDAPEPLRPEDVFVLTRGLKEADQMAEALRTAGVPATFFKRDGVFQSPEALELRDVLRAVEDPSDPVRRAKAWVTEVFGASLQDLLRVGELPETHPFLEQLRTWHDLAEERAFPDLFRSLVDAGLLRRLLRTRPDDRAAGIWLQLTEFMLEQCTQRHGGFSDAVAFLQDCIDGKVTPPGEDADVHRVATDRSAVQILTMHKAKGLEAKVVVLYGGWSAFPGGVVHRFVDQGRRKFWVGAGAPYRIKRLEAREATEEAERLLYVALTRAEAQLILPVFSVQEGQAAVGSFDRATGDPKGDYGVLNRRLRAFLEGPGHPLFQRIVPQDPGQAEPLLDFEPAAEAPIPEPPGDTAQLVQAARVPKVASFTSLSGAYRPTGPRDPEDQAVAEEEGQKLPGGTGVGTGLHALLEAVPSSAKGLDRAAWMALPEVDRALSRCLALAGLDPGHREAFAGLAHQALTVPFQLPGGGPLPTLGDLDTLLSEMAFLMRRPGSTELLDGSIDVLFQWQGRAFFLDWKTNQLRGGYGPGSCAETLRAHYALQFAIYTLAACRFLGIQDEAAYEARFGGGLYVFLRGLPEGGQIAHRPAWSEVQAWAKALNEGREEAIHVAV